MPRDTAKTHAFEYRLQQAFFRRRKFDKFEPIETQRVIKQIGHMHTPEI
jgi:hypothetical protein